MMRILVLAMLLIVACSGQNPESNEPVINMQEPLKTLPLSVQLQSEKLAGTGMLQTTLNCVASGGKEPYTYQWGGVYCERSTCDISLSSIGMHVVKCSVYDSQGNSAASSLTLTVEKEKRKIDSIIAFGDSLTYGYGLTEPEKENWAAIYAGSFDDAKLYNYAVSGADSGDVLQKQLMSYQSDSVTGSRLVFLWIGANDIVNFRSPEAFEANYREIVKSILEMPNTELIVMTIPDATKLPVADQAEREVNNLLSQVGVQVSLKSIGEDVILSYNNVIRKVSEDENLTIFDMFIFMEALDDSYLTEDGFHPSEKGQKAIADKVKEEMGKAFPKVEFY